SSSTSMIQALLRSAWALLRLCPMSFLYSSCWYHWLSLDCLHVKGGMSDGDTEYGTAYTGPIASNPPAAHPPVEREGRPLAGLRFARGTGVIMAYAHVMGHRYSAQARR